MAGLVAGQLAEDGIYPDAGAAFEAAETDAAQQAVQDYSPDQPRDPQGRWSEANGSASESAVEAHQQAAPTTIPTTLTHLESVPAEVQRHSSPLEPSPSSEVSPSPIQVAANTTTTFKYACKKLKIDPIQASEALHAAKEALNLGGAAVCTFDLQTGDIIFNGEIIGNLRD
jgi:hypothetical protein